MKRLPLYVTAILVLGIVYSGCYYDKADLVYPVTNVTCDTSNVTYSLVVSAILAQNCNSCHGGSAALGGGIKLDNYTNLLAYAKNGHLINDIQQNPGSDPMPKGGSKLSVCDINKIVVWVNNGTPNN